MRLLRRIWYRLNRRWWERELEREMAAHRAAMGEPQRFGNLLRLREESADMWGWTWLDDLGRDLRNGAPQSTQTWRPRRSSAATSCRARSCSSRG